MAAAPTQIPFELRIAPDFSRAAFEAAPSNQEALSAIESVAPWPNRALALAGPRGTGKTHLGHIWISAQTGKSTAARNRLALSDLDDLNGHAVWMDNADKVDEQVLFGLINMALLERLTSLLLTSRALPSDWNVKIPDLRSRLNALTVARIDPPEDALLRRIYVNLLAERGRQPDGAVIDYLVNYGERSAAAAQKTAAALDVMAASKKSKITKALARIYFESQGELF
ncbi:P-loop NTPase family protein [Robiginitomaculum antarcticum]|uniref:hypothetical protein n=1 Tax=Robiginitomaculum antarcticum TaxID=437507 RepID=UPI00036C8F4B|nr:hypothetical protein [Robiginitomaculum antarcticum]